jgi:hypothetical protein
LSDPFASLPSIQPSIQPAIDWIDGEIQLRDVDGDDVGRIVEINPDFIVTYAHSGPLGLGEARAYFVPRQLVGPMQDDGWTLTIDRGQITQMDLLAPPAASAWSEDWMGSETAYELHPWRGQTRVRSYAEPLTSERP